jgi:hypothetical protein
MNEFAEQWIIGLLGHILEHRVDLGRFARV